MTCSATLIDDKFRRIWVWFDYEPYEEATNSGDDYFIEKVIYNGRDITGLVDLERIRIKVIENES